MLITTGSNISDLLLFNCTTFLPLRQCQGDKFRAGYLVSHLQRGTVIRAVGNTLVPVGRIIFPVSECALSTSRP